jgi:hypothetical protein
VTARKTSPRTAAGTSAAVSEENDDNRPSAQDRISEIVAGLGADGFAEVWREDAERGGDDAFCGRFPLDVISPDWIKQRGGGGRYRIQFKKRGKGGGSVYAGQVSFTVDRSIAPKSFDAPSGGSPGAPSGTKAAVESLVESQVMSIMTAQVELLQLQMEKLRAPPTDWKSLIIGAGTILSPIVLALIQKGAKSDPLDTALKIQEAIARQNPPAAGDSLTALEAALGTVERLKALTGGGGSDHAEEGWVAVAKQGLPLLERGLELMATQTRAAAAPAHQLPAGDHPEPAPAALPPEGNQSMLNLLTAYLPQLGKMAALGRDSSTYAHLIIDQVPDEHLAALHEFARTEGQLEALVAAFPNPIGKYRVWFGALLQELVAALDELQKPDDGEESEPAAGEPAGPEGNLKLEP